MITNGLLKCFIGQKTTNKTQKTN